jgi:hypothetical protein
MKNKLKIIFSPSSTALKNKIIEPVPAIKMLPEWYKKISRFYKDNSIRSLNPINDRGTDGSASSTKLCMPFFDAMTSGYMYLLDEDLHVSLDEEGRPVLNWAGDIMICDKRLMNDVAIPYQHHPSHFGFKMHWYYETPPGYSVLITHPMNRHDLPFTTLSGIVDSDIWGLPVFISFFLKRNFVGVIPKGTPLFQIIPIKREEWSHEIDYSEEKNYINKIEEEKRRSKIFSYYKGYAWRRKKYE